MIKSLIKEIPFCLRIAALLIFTYIFLGYYPIADIRSATTDDIVLEENIYREIMFSRIVLGSVFTIILVDALSKIIKIVSRIINSNKTKASIAKSGTLGQD
jgi:hypothetical protein